MRYNITVDCGENTSAALEITSKFSNTAAGTTLAIQNNTSKVMMSAEDYAAGSEIYDDLKARNAEISSDHTSVVGTTFITAKIR